MSHIPDLRKAAKALLLRIVPSVLRIFSYSRSHHSAEGEGAQHLTRGRGLVERRVEFPKDREVGNGFTISAHEDTSRNG